VDYFGFEIGSVVDWYMAPLFYFLIVYVLNRNIKFSNDAEARLFSVGLQIKMFSALSIALIYLFYYGGGDTIIYMHDADILAEMFWYEPSIYFDLLFNGMYDDHQGMNSMWKYFYEIRSYNLPYFVYRTDERAFFMVRIASLMAILTNQSFVASGLIIGAFSYLGTWKIYKLFVEYYPTFRKPLSYTILFIPSVMFWGSGVLKDPVTLGSLGFVMYYFHNLLKGRKILVSIIYVIIFSFFIISIKPYIINAFIVGMGCWLLANYMVKVKSAVFKAMFFPLLLVASVGAVFGLLSLFSGETGNYSFDKALDEAALVQSDLKQDYYGGHRFDIGTFEPTLSGVLSKAPIAIATTLYRPFVWEAHNVFVMLSAVESTIIIIFTFLAIFRIKLFNLQGVLLANPLLFFSFVFSLFFAFFIGLTSANFGALVRYKIPLMPFYMSMVYILSNYNKLPKKHQEVLPAGVLIT
jgi:hypothetical protein